MLEKTYDSLVRKYKEQPNHEIFAHFPYAKNETWDTPYKELAKLAKSEDWNFNYDEFKNDGDDFPILKNYLNYTFLRVQELDLISYSNEDTIDGACFNTGLQTKEDKDIYALFTKNKQPNNPNPDWTLFGFVDSYSKKLTPYHPLPAFPTYISDPADLVFDPKLDLEINTDHIIDTNNERLPQELRTNKRLAMNTLNGSIQYLKSKVLRNYKVAIPHWYNDKIQLLLPLNLLSENKADVALVIDKDIKTNKYRGTTILTMDQAYNNARLITRPDREWLNV